MSITSICQRCGKTFQKVFSNNRYCSECVTGICNYCGKSFTVFPCELQIRKYCSRDCYALAQRTKVSKICIFCQKTFYPRISGQLHCSNLCRNQSCRIEKYCKTCGKIFITIKSHPKQYCSISCAHTKTKINKICPTCGKNFKVSYWNRFAKFCSKVCYTNSGRFTLSCKYCGKNFSVILSKDRQYCSRICYMQDSDKLPTKLEILIQQYLPDNIKYVGNGKYWVLFKNGQRKNPDFKVTKQKKIIEIYGDYWHRNENTQNLIDLYSAIGYKCLILWESEIKNNLSNALNKIAIFLEQATWQMKLF